MRVFTIAAALLALVLMAGARAHDWYPAECCHGKENGGDCEPVEADTLVPAKEQGCWIYLPTAVKFCGQQVRMSPDKHWHVCIGVSESGYTPHCVFINPSF